MAEGLPAAASRLWDGDPEPYRGPGAGVGVMAGGEHSPGHRQATLQEFAPDGIELSENRWEQDLLARAARAPATIRL